MAQNINTIRISHEDVDQAVLEYIHKLFPETKGLDIEHISDDLCDWEFVEPPQDNAALSARIAELEEQVLDLEQENDDLRETLKDTERELNECENSCEQYIKELDESEDECHNIGLENSRLVQRIGKLEKENESLRLRNKNQSESLKTFNEQVKQHKNLKRNCGPECFDCPCRG